MVQSFLNVCCCGFAALRNQIPSCCLKVSVQGVSCCSVHVSPVSNQGKKSFSVPSHSLLKEEFCVGGFFRLAAL